MDNDIRRGVAAQQVLSSDIYKESFKTIEERLIAELCTIEIKPERAEYLRQLITVGRKYRQYLEQVMVTGKYAEEQKSLMDRVKDGARAFVR